MHPQSPQVPSVLRLLQDGTAKLGIWGLGYIGFTSLAFFARAGVRCIGYDVQEEKVHAVNQGRSPVQSIEHWLGFDTVPLALRGLMRATSQRTDLLASSVHVHLICVPTELSGEPFYGHLLNVMQSLATHEGLRAGRQPLIIIESTISPSTVDDLVIPLLGKAGVHVGSDVLIGVAPRRDWFISPDKTLKTVARVAGGTNKCATDAMLSVLALVCDNLHPAPDHKHAALVKSIENAYRHVEIALANELSRAYPNLDMREILRLVGTKWNVGTFHPSFGTGGYCIPLAPKYVLAGALHPDCLSILRAAVEADRTQSERVLQVLLSYKPSSVGILGLAYKGDLKVEILSPAITIAKGLCAAGIRTCVHDPYYTTDEIRNIVGAPTFDFPDDLKNFDIVCIVADHLRYKCEPSDRLRDCLKNCRVIFDNVAVWRGRSLGTAQYYYAGAPNWLRSASL